MSDDRMDKLLAKLEAAIADDEKDELHIFSNREVTVLRKVISWIDFAQKLGGLGKVILWLITAIGAAYLSYGEVVDRIRGASGG